MSMKNSNDTIGNQNSYLPAYSAVPQPNFARIRTKFKDTGLRWGGVGGRGFDLVCPVVPAHRPQHPAEASSPARAA